MKFLNSRSFSLIIFALNFFNQNSDAARNFKVILRSADLKVHDPIMITYSEMNLRPYKGQTALHFEFETSKQIDNFDIRLLVYTPRQKQPLFDMSTNGCDCLRMGPEQTQLVKLLSRAILSDSQIPRKCPLPANQRFIIEHFHLTAENFPPITPELNAFANFSCLIKKKAIFSFNVNYEFKRT